VYNYGNLAYKDYPPEIEEIRRRNNIERAAKRNQRQMASRKNNFFRISAIVVLALAAGFMISQYVAVHESRSVIEGLEEKLRAEEAATSQKTFELERSVDLSEIEEEATTRLGMQRPEKYQTIYINVPREDVTNATSGEVEGIINTIKTFLKEAGSNIVEFFSIK